MRQVVLDTETTGISWKEGNRLVEIGCVELINRRPTGREYQVYINPERDMEPRAQEITGLSRAFLSDKAKFVDVVDEFLVFIQDAELIIHNAEFDIGFLNNELRLLGGSYGSISQYSTVLDTLKLARDLYPGQRNSLDSLCKRLEIDNKHRHLHGALLDAKLLVEVYLQLTSGQTGFGFQSQQESVTSEHHDFNPLGFSGQAIVLKATSVELDAHKARIEKISKKSGLQAWVD